MKGTGPLIPARARLLVEETVRRILKHKQRREE